MLRGRFSGRLRGATALIVVAMAVSHPSLSSEGGGTCPPNLQVWRVLGNAEAGGEWGAQILEVRGDIGILREVTIRFGDGALPAEEARWFEAPSVLEPDTVHTRTLSFLGEELLSFCRDLPAGQMTALREKYRPRCVVNDSGVRMMVRSLLSVTTDADAEPPGRTEAGIGFAVGSEEFEDSELECEQVEDLAVAFRAEEDSGSDSTPFGSIHAMLDDMAATDGLLETGLAAVPPARHVLGVLRARDEDRLPEDLPSEFYLTVTAASGAYAEALALERMLTAGDRDEEVALKVLGDLATSASTPLLRLRLRAAVSESRPRIGSLTLRALLRADVDAARLEAVRLLARPLFVRPALGVFALSEPASRDDLESIDPDDVDALAKAGMRVLVYLRSAAAEDEIRRLASESLDELEGD